MLSKKFALGPAPPPPPPAPAPPAPAPPPPPLPLASTTTITLAESEALLLPPLRMGSAIEKKGFASQQPWARADQPANQPANQPTNQPTKPAEVFETKQREEGERRKRRFFFLFYSRKGWLIERGIFAPGSSQEESKRWQGVFEGRPNKRVPGTLSWWSRIDGLEVEWWWWVTGFAIVGISGREHHAKHCPNRAKPGLPTVLRCAPGDCTWFRTSRLHAQ